MLNRWNLLKTGFYEGIKLDHPSVDSAHALIRASQGRHTLFDLGSAAGTWVNGDAVSGTFIGDGSSISVGSTELYFTRIGSAAADPESKGFGKNGVLMVRSGPSKGSSFPVGDDDVVIGRKSGEGGAQIDDPSFSPNPPKDTDGRREESGRGG